MSFIPCVTLANATTPVTSIGGSSGGAPIAIFSDVVCSTITCAPTTATAGVKVQGNPVNGSADVLFTSPNVSTLFQMSAVYNGSAQKYDFKLYADPTNTTGIFNMPGIKKINFPAGQGNLNISTINGQPPLVGTSVVTSVSSDNFSSIVCTTNAGAVTCSLGAKSASLGGGTTSVFNFQTQTNTSVSGIISNLTTPLGVTTLTPGWYNITFNGVQLFVASTQTGTPLSSIAYPGSLIEHFVQVNTSLGTNTCYLQSTPVVPNPALGFVVYPQSTFLNLTGSIYIPAGATIETMYLRTYFNTTEGSSGLTITGSWCYNIPTSSPENWVTLQKVLKA